MYLRVLLISLVLTLPALAQQADPVFLQRAITAVQTQRNLALDAQAVAEAKLVALTERIKELESKKELEPKKEEGK